MHLPENTTQEEITENNVEPLDQLEVPINSGIFQDEIRSINGYVYSAGVFGLLTTAKICGIPTLISCNPMVEHNYMCQESLATLMKKRKNNTTIKFYHKVGNMIGSGQSSLKILGLCITHLTALDSYGKGIKRLKVSFLILKDKCPVMVSENTFSQLGADVDFEEGEISIPSKDQNGNTTTESFPCTHKTMTEEDIAYCRIQLQTDFIFHKLGMIDSKPHVEIIKPVNDIHADYFRVKIQDGITVPDCILSFPECVE